MLYEVITSFDLTFSGATPAQPTKRGGPPLPNPNPTKGGPPIIPPGQIVGGTSTPFAVFTTSSSLRR